MLEYRINTAHPFLRQSQKSYSRKLKEWLEPPLELYMRRAETDEEVHNVQDDIFYFVECSPAIQDNSLQEAPAVGNC